MSKAIETRHFDEPVEGLTITARMFYDECSSDRLSDDCYTDEDRQAYRDDDWTFVGIEVTASAEGFDLGSASIWGMEFGTWSDGSDFNPLEDSHGDFASGYGAELITEAVDEARHALRNLAPLVAAAAAHKTDEDN